MSGFPRILQLFNSRWRGWGQLLVTGCLLLVLTACTATPSADASEAELAAILAQLPDPAPLTGGPNPFKTPPVPRNLPPTRATAVGPVCQAMQPAIGREAYSMANFRPEIRSAWAHPTNFGDRAAVDRNGQPVDNRISLIVLHETVASADSAINFFQTPHPRDEDQASYHALIRRNGTIVYTVPPDKRAFGAGSSSFRGESVRFNPKLPGSVNNFALHVSLESPRDGRDNRRRHSGYTARQYDSLALIVQQWMTGYTIPGDRITTHAAVDQSGSRMDPRSFQWQRLAQRLQLLNEGTIPGCADPDVGAGSSL
ncbi:N-acetylmuramoyl-L-alanine amidase [Synechococcus elongatus]|uniref:N-acetylmuramoyl-L-alanine amidase n=1 Tax=Synechococcus elongatus PCC 11801 TaxID=2219813 RepID=A0AAN1UU41_SYNEL|nr:peptidoglycan recognition family protein [Synechococcus elongatus]AZB72173.1 N-acetylmuramoyl-L-alanine amidase [Synechococcus elongatus PCC 11801]